MLTVQSLTRRHRERDSSSWSRGVGPARDWLARGGLASQEGWTRLYFLAGRLAVATMQQIRMMCGVGGDEVTRQPGLECDQGPVMLAGWQPIVCVALRIAAHRGDGAPGCRVRSERFRDGPLSAKGRTMG